MKKYVPALVAIASLTVLTGNVLAADDTISIAPPAYGWSGIYIGVQGGYGFGTNTWEAEIGGESDSGDLTGIFGGLTAGVNMQMGDFVFGAEGDISWANIEGDSTSNITFSCAIDDCHTDVDWFGTVRGRAGYAMGNTLPYLTGGFAFGNASGTADAGLGSYVVGEDTLTGYAVGAGIEQAFSPNISAKIEYMYVDLGTLDLPNNCVGGCSTDINFSTVKLGLNYKF